MRTLTFTYPGDLPQEAVEMTRAEFLERYPCEPMRLTDLKDGSFEEFPIPANAVVCDFCDDDVTEKVYVLTSVNYAICRKCAERQVLPYSADGHA